MRIRTVGAIALTGLLFLGVAFYVYMALFVRQYSPSEDPSVMNGPAPTVDLRGQ